MRRIVKRMSGTLLVLCFLVANAHPASLADAIEAARGHVRQHLAPKVPGVSLAVGREGKIIWSEGFGFADLAAHKPVTAQTQFRIGSVSKPLTAAGLMRLVEQGKIALDADLHQYVPDYPDKGTPITPRQLAGHLAGIRSYRGTEYYSNQHYDSVRASLKIFENDPLLFQPGDRFFYSSYGFNLLSMIMESAARQNFLDYMQQAVFTPLHMTNTVPDDARRELPQRTCFYQPGTNSTNFVLAPAVDYSSKWASAGFLSTPDDLVRFGLALLHPGFLKRASLDAMFTSQKTAEGKSTGYGLGWFVHWRTGSPGDLPDPPVWFHDGGGPGGNAILIIHPDTGLVLAIACNYDNPQAKSGPLDKDTLQLLADDFTAVFQ